MDDGGVAADEVGQPPPVGGVVEQLGIGELLADGQQVDRVSADAVRGARCAALAGHPVPNPRAAAIRWAYPTWSRSKRPVCSLTAASAHITFGFWRGAPITDRSGRLETSGHVMAYVELRAKRDGHTDFFAEWLAQARDLEADAGA